MLHDTAGTRLIERAAMLEVPAHALMQRAGLACARLAMAVAPHAGTVWVACGPGNNGGDGLEAAIHLRQWGKQVFVTRIAGTAQPPADAQHALDRAKEFGIEISSTPPNQWDLGIDAMLGLGATRPPPGEMAQWTSKMNQASAPVLAVDIPTGLNADTGAAAGPCVNADVTLSLLTLKPGLFTADGRDASGEVWFDDLNVPPEKMGAAPVAHLSQPPARNVRLHNSHKGSYGDVAVIGGASGMVGAALLAATAALTSGAGRVFVALLAPDGLKVDPSCPELMFRRIEELDLRHTTLVCGCGGGTAVEASLFQVLRTPAPVVLDADAINSIAFNPTLAALVRERFNDGWSTVLTPHPLEAARLLHTTTQAVQQDRLGAAKALTEQLRCTVVVKGSGTVIAHPGRTPVINCSGNARLATAGTGDVLAGMIGARLSGGMDAFSAACDAVHAHGALADGWPADAALTAGALARAGGLR